MDSLLNAMQWPAMIATLVAAWFVASQSKRKRAWGFGIFVVSNVLWIVWGWHDHAYALIVLQVGLFALNLRGARKNEA
jgi:TctA family transporter